MGDFASIAVMADRPEFSANCGRRRALLEWLRSDNGPEFIAEAVKQGLAERGSKPRYIDPGCPWQNAYAESFNGRLRDECLNLELFATRRDAAVILEAWRCSYNAQRPHRSLGYRTPDEFRDAFVRGATVRLRPPDG